MHRGVGRAPVRVLATVLGLTVVVTVGSGGAPIWTPRGIPGLDRKSIVAALAALFALFLLAATIWTLARGRRGSAGSGAGRSLRSIFARVLPVVVTGWVVVGLFGIAEGKLGRPPETHIVGPRPEPTLIGKTLRFIGGWDVPVVDGQGRPPPSGAAGAPGPTPPLALIAGLLAVAVAMAWWVWRQSGDAPDRDGAPPGEDEPGALDAAATHRAVVATIEAMLADPDPNTAVIGAYARLLEGLSRVGAPRRAYEGPEEHLSRVLRTLRVRPAPVLSLVTLFETARFSAASLTATHRDRALEALDAVATDLSEGAIAPAGAARRE